MNGALGALILAAVLGGGFWWAEIKPGQDALAYLKDRGFINLAEVSGLDFLPKGDKLWQRNWYFADATTKAAPFYGVQIDTLVTDSFPPTQKILQACISEDGNTCTTTLPVPGAILLDDGTQVI